MLSDKNIGLMKGLCFNAQTITDVFGNKTSVLVNKKKKTQSYDDTALKYIKKIVLLSHIIIILYVKSAVTKLQKSI